MMTLIWFLLGVAAFWILAAYRAPGYLWAGSAGAGLALWTVLTRQPAEILFLMFGLFLLVVLPLNISLLRRLIISNPLLHLFRKKVPHMSQTEREALAAGTVWWDADLFSGRPDWKKLLSVPVPRMTSEEQAFLDGPVEELCQMLDDCGSTRNTATFHRKSGNL